MLCGSYRYICLLVYLLSFAMTTLGRLRHLFKYMPGLLCWLLLSVRKILSGNAAKCNWCLDAAGALPCKPSNEQVIIKCTHVLERNSLGQVVQCISRLVWLKPGSCSQLQPK